MPYPSAFDDRGLLKKHPLAGTTLAKLDSADRTNFMNLHQRAVALGGLGRNEFAKVVQGEYDAATNETKAHLAKSEANLADISGTYKRLRDSRRDYNRRARQGRRDYNIARRDAYRVQKEILRGASDRKRQLREWKDRYAKLHEKPDKRKHVKKKYVAGREEQIMAKRKYKLSVLADQYNKFFGETKFVGLE